MTTTYYRLRYRNGEHGAWTTDYERIVKDAEDFKAENQTIEHNK